jgi:hypothetical protein
MALLEVEMSLTLWTVKHAFAYFGEGWCLSQWFYPNDLRHSEVTCLSRAPVNELAQSRRSGDVKTSPL